MTYKGVDLVYTSLWYSRIILTDVSQQNNGLLRMVSELYVMVVEVSSVQISIHRAIPCRILERSPKILLSRVHFLENFWSKSFSLGIEEFTIHFTHFVLMEYLRLSSCEFDIYNKFILNKKWKSSFQMKSNWKMTKIRRFNRKCVS